MSLLFNMLSRLVINFLPRSNHLLISWLQSPSVTGMSLHHNLHSVYIYPTAAAAKSLQLCPTLCDPIDGSPLGSSVPGILLARILEWVAILFSRGSSWPRNQTCVSYGSCIGRRILYHWATWEAPIHTYLLNIQKTKIMASGPITSWQIDGETVADFIFGEAPKSLHMVTAAMKLKDAYTLEGKLWPT